MIDFIIFVFDSQFLSFELRNNIISSENLFFSEINQNNHLNSSPNSYSDTFSFLVDLYYNMLYNIFSPRYTKNKFLIISLSETCSAEQ
jgi:hypothetical protein